MSKRLLSPKLCSSVFLLSVILPPFGSSVFAQTTAFTYQGKLTSSGNPASGTFDMQFKLFNTATVGTGTQQGSTVTNSAVQVGSGLFTVQLDFGAGVFNGSTRFLEIGVRPGGDLNPYTVLAPRQEVTSTPYTVRSLNATAADGLSVACVNCVTSSQIASVNGSTVTGSIPVASVPAGSGNYIQNSTSQQATSNFNISGNGTAGGTLSAGTVNATSQYNIGASRVLSVAGANNTFAGLGTSGANTGSDNSFFGSFAGSLNTTGSTNSFFGTFAGRNSTTGSNNSFFGNRAGQVNTTGGFNSFFGSNAGQANQIGINNAFFGTNAGVLNTASFNSFFGARAGDSNTSGFDNAFFGEGAGQANQVGSNNAFFGSLAGDSNTSGGANSFFGYSAGFRNTASLNSFFGSNAGESNTSGTQNAFFGVSAGSSNQIGINNAFFGYQAGVYNTASNNSFFGAFAGEGVSSGTNNTFVGFNASASSNNLTNATALGANAIVGQSNTLLLGNNVNVGIGTASPSHKLTVHGGDSIVRIAINSNAPALNTGVALQHDGVTKWALASSSTDGDFQIFEEDGGGNRLYIKGDGPNRGNVGIGTTTPTRKLEVNGSVGGVGPYQDISDRRYKTNIATIANSLEKLRRLRGVSFDWRQDEFPNLNFGKGRQVGFIAQEVEHVLPEVVSKDGRGMYSVAYSSMVPLLVEAIKQQQKQVEQISTENAALRERLAALEQAVEKLMKK